VDLARLATMSGRVSATGGAAFYAAPEVGSAATSVKMDVFSFGIMAAEMIVGFLPDDAGILTAVDVVREYGIEGRSRMVKAAIARVSRDTPIASMLKGCIEADPATRFSAEQALAVLDPPPSSVRRFSDDVFMFFSKIPHTLRYCVSAATTSL
jgi:serine/threonine protein kinase